MNASVEQAGIEYFDEMIQTITAMKEKWVAQVKQARAAQCMICVCID